MKLIKRFFRFIDKKIIVPITKFFVSIGEKLKLSDKPLEKALSKKSSMIILSLVLAVIVFVIIDRQNTTLLEKMLKYYMIYHFLQLIMMKNMLLKDFLKQLI